MTKFQNIPIYVEETLAKVYVADYMIYFKKHLFVFSCVALHTGGGGGVQQIQKMTQLAPENDQPAFDIVHTDNSFHDYRHPSLLKEDPNICNNRATMKLNK